MSSSDSDDSLGSGSESDEGFLSAGDDTDSENEAQEPQPHAKKRKVDGSQSLGLELVTQHHGGGGGGLVASTLASHIDGSEEAVASLMQLEVEELLKDARPDYSLETALLELVASLAAMLRALPDAEVAADGKEAAAVRGLLSDLAYQPVRPFVFRSPSRVQVVGSFGLRAALRPSPCLDLALLMPAACFDSKDQLNHRYFAKRALYLAHMAAALKGHPQLSGMQWDSLADDPRRPALVLHPHNSPGGFSIRLLLAAPLELCPQPRLAPDRNNLRSAVAPPPPKPPTPPLAAEAAAAADGKGKAGKGSKGSKVGKAAKAAKGGKKAQQANGKGKGAPAPVEQPAEQRLLPTPHYNTSVLQDLLMMPLAEECRAAAASCPHFSDAAALLRVWAQQQQLSQGADGLSGCMLTLLLVHLVQGGQATASMSAILLFRAVLVLLSRPRSFTPGLFMQRQPPASPTATPPEAKAWRRAFEVVFVDSSGWLNLAAAVSKSALSQARGAATRSLQLLSGGTPEAFGAVFLARQQRAALCDYWFHVTVPAAAAVAADAGGNSGGSSKDLQQDQPSWRSIEQKVEALATKALGSRARLVRAFRRTLHQQAAPAGGSKAPFKSGAASPQQEHVLLGVQVDATAALRSIDLGPAADKVEAARAFRAFWGDEAELRRFQDGTISEALMWEGDPAHRHLIVDSIVSYILQRHLPPGASVACHAGALDAALRRKHSTPEADEAAARLCEAAAERLGKRLRTLAADTLPLRVVAVQPLAPVLRHTAAFPPLPQLLAGAAADPLVGDHTARCLQPVELLCQLEGSGKWPDSPLAYQKMKAAMGCQLARQLHTTLGMHASAAEGWVDVLTDGFAFRLLLGTERDEAMQLKAQEEMGGAQALAAEDDMGLRAWHQGAISGVAGENPAFEPAARLAKRWVGAHLLSPHLCEEAVELMLAHCFTAAGRPAGDAGGGSGTQAVDAAPAPASRLSGLLRFLQLLADHPWRVQPLVVDPNAELSSLQRDAIVRQHAAARARGVAPALCLPTPRDSSGGAWTAGRPSAQVLPRIAVLAQRSAAALESLLLGSSRGSSTGHSNGVAGPTTAAAETEGTEGAAADQEAATPAAAAQAAALQAVFSRDLGEYDVLIRIKPDALPNAANDLRLGKSSKGNGSSSGSANRQQLGPALQAANEQLAAAAAAAAAVPSAKHCRAILKGIPQSVLSARGHHAVRRELLVGFDPLPIYTQLLQRRLSHLAVACADYVGGSVVALKWRAAAFGTAPLRPETAHLVCPAGSEEAAAAEALAGRWQKASGGHSAAVVANGRQQQEGELISVAAVVPDVVGVLMDALSLGAGLVDSVQLQ